MKHTKLRLSLITLLWLVAPAGAWAQTSNAAAAQQRYSRGVTLFEAGHYADALAEFRASQSLFGSPNSRLFIARSLMQLGDPVHAVTEYEQTIREAEDRAQTDVRYRETRSAAETELREVATHVAHVVVTIPGTGDGSRVYLGEQEIPHEALGMPIVVAPGSVRVRLVTPDATTQSRDVVVAQGQTQSVAFETPVVPASPVESSSSPPPSNVIARVPPPPHRMPLHRIISYSALGAGAALLAASGVLALVTNQHYLALRAQCGDASCPESARADLNAGRTLQTFTDLTLALGLTGVAAGALLYGFGPRVERIVPRLAFSFTSSAIAVSGAF